MVVQPTFHLRVGDTNFGKLEVYVGNNGDFGTINTDASIGITDPLGNEIKPFPVSPDFTHNVPGDYNVFVDIPLTTGGTAANGDWLTGTYTIRVLLENNEGPEEIDETKTFYFCPQDGVLVAADFDTVYDCFSKKIVATDNTDYSNVTEGTRTITIAPPPIPGKPTPTTVTSSEQQLITDLEYEFATYDLTLSMPFTTGEVDSTTGNTWTWTIEEEVLASVSQEVICDLDGCGILECYSDFHDRIHVEAQKKGGLMGIRESERDLYIQVNGAVNLWLMYKACQDTANMKIQYDKIKQLLNATGCQCESVAGPKVIAASSGIVYITGPSAYDLWISEGNEGTLDDFFGSLNPATEWAAVDGADFSAEWQQSSPNLMYRILTRHLEFKGAFVRTLAHSPQTTPNTRILLEDTFLPATPETASKIPVFNDEAGCVGYFYYDSADGHWKMREVDGFNAANPTFIDGALPIIGTLDTSGLITSAWTDFAASDLEGDFMPTGSNILKYKLYPDFIVFRGAFENTSTPVTGQAITKIIDVAFFTALNIQIEPNAVGALVDASSTDNEFVGVIRPLSSGLYLYSTAGYDSNNAGSVVGVFPISSL